MAGVCGRDCGGCAFRREYGCRGCLETEGHPVWGECRVVRCCHGKGLSCCGECPSAETCGASAAAEELRERFPQEETARREQEAERRAARRAKMAWKAPILARELLVMFWVSIVGMVFGLLGEIPLDSGVSLVLDLLNLAASAAVLVCYWKLSQLSDRFRTVWRWQLAVLGLVGLGIVVALVVRGAQSLGALLLLLLLAAAGGSIAVLFQFCEAMAEQLDGEEQHLADNWRLLRKWMLGSLAAAVGFSLLIFLLSTLAALLALGAALVLAGCSIAEQVLLWQSARFFREQAASAALSSPEV